MRLALEQVGQVPVCNTAELMNKNWQESLILYVVLVVVL